MGIPTPWTHLFPYVWLKNDTINSFFNGPSAPILIDMILINPSKPDKQVRQLNRKHRGLKAKYPNKAFRIS